jgi:hypothetical protein
MLSKGLRVPPPPALPAGSPVRGEQCTQCGAPTAVVMSGKIYRTQPPSATMLAGDVGRAVVGGEPMMMMVDAGGPMPIGVVAPMSIPSPVPPGALAGRGPAAGPRDASVMPASMAADPVEPPASNRPHIVSHLLGFSAIGRDWSDARARAREEAHAKIPYGPQPASPVADLPASMVYGRR